MSTIGPEDARAFASAWMAAWNAHDLDGIVEHYAGEVEPRVPLESFTNPRRSPPRFAGRESAQRSAFRFDPEPTINGNP